MNYLHGFYSLGGMRGIHGLDLDLANRTIGEKNIREEEKFQEKSNRMEWWLFG